MRPLSFAVKKQGQNEKKKKMNKFVFIATTVISVAMTGCVSIEDQLNSQDPNVRVQGEYRLLTNARLSGKPEEVVSAINRIQTKSLLLEIAKNASQKRIGEGQAALSKLTDEKDFATLACSAEAPQIRRMAFAKVSKQETFLAICTQAGDPMIRKFAMDKLSPDNLAKLPYSSALLPYWKKITDQKTLAKIYRDGCGTFPQEDLKAIAEKIDDEAILEEMVIPPPGRETAMAQRNRENEIFKLSNEIKELRNKAEERNKDANRAKKNWDLREEKRARQEVYNLLAQITQIQKRLDLMKNSPVTGLYVTNRIAQAALYGRIKNADVFGRIATATDEYGRPLFKTREQLIPILEKMPEDKALEFALGKLKSFGIYQLGNDDLVPLEIAVSLAGVAKESKTRVRLAVEAFGRIESIKDECKKDFRYNWRDSSEKFAREYAESFSLSEDEKAEILAMGSLAGRRVAEIAGEETARKALTSGRSLGRDIEEQLVAKIPADKIDLLLYESVKSKVAKDALYEKMSDSVKESINAASATQEATASNKPSVKVSVGDVNIATINMDDVVAAIKTWQKERWEADKIVAIRKSKGRVAVDDLKLSANYKGIQPLLDIMIADYIIYVNVLDSFVDAQTPKDAVAMLLKSLSMDDIVKMAKDFASAVDSAKSIKDNAGWRDVIPIGKDMVTIYAVSSSMTNASGILKGIFDKLMSK